MRISFIQPGYPWKPYGALRVVYEYANQLVGKGFEVRVIHVRKLREPNAAPVRGVKARLRGVLRNARDTLFTPRVDWQPLDPRVNLIFVARTGPTTVPDGDAIFATAWDTVADVLHLPESKGEKCYLIQSYDTWSGRQDRVDATWRAPLHKVVIARWLYENGRRLGCQDMIYIPNGIDISRFRVIMPLEERLPRVAVRYSEPAFRGIKETVQALESARARHPGLQAAFFGTSPAPRWIPGWIQYRQNPPQRELIERIYNGSSIFLMSSWTEAFPLPPMEAMACGCALVTTDCGGVNEYAVHKVNCLMSPPQMPEALADNLLRLLDDDALRLRLARSAADSVKTFAWSESGNRMAAFLAECTQRPRQRQVEQ